MITTIPGTVTAALLEVLPPASRSQPVSIDGDETLATVVTVSPELDGAGVHGVVPGPAVLPVMAAPPRDPFASKAVARAGDARGRLARAEGPCRVSSCAACIKRGVATSQ